MQVYDSVSQAYTPNIPFNVDKGSLQAGFRRITGFGSVEVLRLTNDCEYGCLYLISFLKYNNDVPDLSLSSAMLAGGQAGTFPQISFLETRKYSSNLLFNPVDERMMRTAADGPHVHVTVNGVLSACTGQCDYTFQVNNP